VVVNGCRNVLKSDVNRRGVSG